MGGEACVFASEAAARVVVAVTVCSWEDEDRKWRECRTKGLPQDVNVTTSELVVSPAECNRPQLMACTFECLRCTPTICVRDEPDASDGEWQVKTDRTVCSLRRVSKGVSAQRGAEPVKHPYTHCQAGLNI